MDFTKIKLVIWDLDETFWRGILSEHTVSPIQENLDLVRDMADAGVMNSVCSKNDPEEAKRKLAELGVLELFVFPSINWSAKGERVRQIVQEMNLRAVNVLFVDDNETNLAEVRAACSGIMTANVEILPELWTYYRQASKKDTAHARLAQYRVLERKLAFKATTGSNLEFLRKSGIRVTVGHDCLDRLERIQDLVARSNQLNFTKRRSNAEELRAQLLDAENDSGYVEVRDNFGDYGLVGFYVKKADTLIHFVFSCRILNMGVEQYVYELLGRPKLEIVGEVSSSLSGPKPDWINQSAESEQVAKHSLQKGKVLIKGQCDLQQMFAFINESANILTEFVYVNNRGVSIEQINHTVNIVQCLTLDDEVKKRLIRELPFGDRGMFTTAIYDKDIRWILLSTISEGNLGLYREKASGAVAAFGEYTNDLTDSAIWDQLIEKKLFTANCQFTKEFLEWFRERYEYLGRIAPEQVVENLTFIYEHIAPEAVLVLSLGTELPYENNTKPAYADRHLYHRQMNELIRQWASGRERVRLLDVNDYVHSQADYTNNINHYTKEIYYHLTEQFIGMVNGGGQTIIKPATATRKKWSELLHKIRKLPNFILRKLRK